MFSDITPFVTKEFEVTTVFISYPKKFSSISKGVSRSTYNFVKGLRCKFHSEPPNPIRFASQISKEAGITSVSGTTQSLLNKYGVEEYPSGFNICFTDLGRDMVISQPVIEPFTIKVSKELFCQLIEDIFIPFPIIAEESKYFNELGRFNSVRLQQLRKA